MGNQINKPSDYFNTKLYTGDGTSSNAITGVNFQPDFLWIKPRSAVDNHVLFDSVRGASNRLVSNETSAEASVSMVNSFDSDGFTLNTDSNVNGNGTTYASWNWLASNTTASNNDGSITSTVSANTTSGFSIVSYTGTGSTTTVGHGLGVKPSIVIYKQRNTTNSWRVMHDIGGTLKRLYLNVTDAEASIIDSSTAPTSTVLNIGTGSEVNTSGGTYIAYCFAEKKGFSKFGSYTGNGSSDGTFVYTGFKPAWILIKRTDSTADWLLHDNKRIGYNPENYYFQANLSDSEGTATPRIDFLSNGFKYRTTSTAYNASGGTYIYMAFAESPLVGTNNTPATAR